MKNTKSFILGVFVTITLLFTIGAVAASIFNAGGGKITNLGTPTVDADAATKEYVDAAGGGRSTFKTARTTSTSTTFTSLASVSGSGVFYEASFYGPSGTECQMRIRLDNTWASNGGTGGMTCLFGFCGTFQQRNPNLNPYYPITFVKEASANDLPYFIFGFEFSDDLLIQIRRASGAGTCSFVASYGED